MRTVIFSGGKINNSKLVTDALTHADAILAADSGAKCALELGITPQAVIGDMDSINTSITKKLKRLEVPFIVSPSEKDETDTQLAIAYAIQQGATEITLIGGTFGDRIDHILANILLGITYSVPVTFINGLQKSFLVKGPHTVSLQGQKNDLLSLIPIAGDVSGISTSGLQWELSNSALIFGKPRGVSNVFLQQTASVELKKGLLFITQTAQARNVKKAAFLQKLRG